MNELLASFVEEMEQLFSYDDAHLELAAPGIEGTLNSILLGPQGQAAVYSIIENFKSCGYDYEQAEATVELTKEGTLQEITELKEKYANSEIKCRLLDMVASVYESLYADILMAYEEELAKIPNILIQKLHPNAKLPTYAHHGDQGADVYAIEDCVIPSHSTGTLIRTGLAAVIPSGWALAVRPRSGMSLKTSMRIANSPGTIDELYRKEIGIIADNIGGEDVVIHAGDRIAQLILEKNYRGTFTEIPDISVYETERGDGFGSSGK